MATSEYCEGRPAGTAAYFHKVASRELVDKVGWHEKSILTGRAPDPAKVTKRIFIIAEREVRHSKTLSMEFAKNMFTTTLKSHYMA